MTGMLITPTGIPYEKLTESHIVWIDANGQHEQGKLPSSEWRFHLAAYQTRPDAQAVVHNHAVHCTAVSILNRPIPAIHYMIAAAGGNSIPCAPYATFGTRELSEFVAVALKHRKATLLQHHGLIACEENLEKRCGWRMKSRFWLNSISVPRRSSILYRCWTTRPLPSYWKNSKPTGYVSKSDSQSEREATMANRMILNETAWFGRGAVAALTDEVTRRGYRKALIVTDNNLAQCGVVDKVTRRMDDAGLAWEIFSGAIPNPTIAVVQEGLGAFQRGGADYLIAIGGGSPQDTCKAIGIIHANPEFADVRSPEGLSPTRNPGYRSWPFRPPQEPRRK